MDANEDDTHIAAVSTIPPGFEQYVNVVLIIAIYNLRCKEIINETKDGEEGETCIVMCANPAGFEHCAKMAIEVVILGKKINWIVCECEASTVPLLA